MASDDDVIHKTRERGDTADEKCNNCAPVGCKFGRVTINAVEIVHIGHRYVATSNYVIAVLKRIILVQVTHGIDFRRSGNLLGHKN